MAFPDIKSSPCRLVLQIFHFKSILTCYIYYSNFLVVKRGISKSTENFPQKSSNILSSSFSQVLGFLGVGILGISVFDYGRFPFSFYAISLIVSIILYNCSKYLIMRVVPHAKIASIVGVAALSGRGLSFFVVLSIFAALFIISSISFSIAFLSIIRVLNNLGKYPDTWLTASIFGAFFALAILFFKNRTVLFPWAKYSFIAITTKISVANLLIQSDDNESIEYLSKSLREPFFDLSPLCLKEFVTSICIFLFALLTGSILNPSIIKAKHESSEKNISYAALISGLISSSVAFLYFILLLSAKNMFSRIFDDRLIANIYIKTFIGILFITSIIIQSMEYYDSAHNIIYNFFKPIFKEKMPLLEVIYVRDSIMIILMFSTAYYMIGYSLIADGIFNVANYALCFALIAPFMIIPAFELIKITRKLCFNLSVGSWLICILSVTSGSVLIIAYCFGLGSLQNNLIFEMMLVNLKNTICLMITCVFIYALFLILDVYFYPPKDNYTINHRTIHSSDAVNYGTNFSVELLIILCIIATFTPLSKYIRQLSASNIIEYGLLYFADIVLRCFTHIGIIHLALNCFTMYQFGKNLSRDIGPFHFVCFFIVAGIMSEMVHDILSTHINCRIVNGFGASHILFALFPRYFFNEGIYFKIIFLKMTSYDFCIITIALTISLIFSDKYTNISHMGHLSGFIFGMFFWSIFKYLLKLRTPIRKLIFKKNIINNTE